MSSIILEMINDGFQAQATKAFNDWLGNNPDMDPIVAERMKPVFVSGFIAAQHMQPTANEGNVQVIPLTPPATYELHRLFMRYVMVVGKAGHIAPNDMMAALLMCIVTIGRALHPSMSNRKVFEIFASESGYVLEYLDKLQSSEGHVRH